VILIVLDSVGVGALPDAASYGDAGSNTLANTARAVGGLTLPTLASLGLGNLARVPGVPPAERPRAFWGKMREVSAGKDTITGHWELMGVVNETPFPTYPRGFPKRIIDPFERRIGRRVLGNKAASGTEIIQQLGAEHMRTGYPIVYTSADSVFQVAAHEEVIPLRELYHICETARSLLAGKDRVARVIARPFVGKPPDFRRTPERRDFSVPPPSETVLDYLGGAGRRVWSAGKIAEIFAGRGIEVSEHATGNMDCLDRVERFMKRREPSLIFANLVDFDTLWGHRNDPDAYARGLAEVDGRLPRLIERMRREDLLVLTADHGCDPTTPSTDHSREYVPLLVFGTSLASARALGTRDSFADVGKTIAGYLGAEAPVKGISFLRTLGVPGRVR